MDDAALWFALDAVPAPTKDEPSAGPTWFVPMIDWFARTIQETLPDLERVAGAHASAPISAAQALDRLLWFDSWGYRLSHGQSGLRWWWVKRGEREGVVPVPPPHPDLEAGSCIDLNATPDSEWSEIAGAALKRMPEG